MAKRIDGGESKNPSVNNLAGTALIANVCPSTVTARPVTRAGQGHRQGRARQLPSYPFVAQKEKRKPRAGVPAIRCRRGTFGELGGHMHSIGKSFPDIGTGKRRDTAQGKETRGTSRRTRDRRRKRRRELIVVHNKMPTALSPMTHPCGVLLRFSLLYSSECARVNIREYVYVR